MVGIKPSEMVEGGAVPVDMNLLVKEALFNLFDYQGKAPPTTACRLILVNDDGTEYVQQYSAADPARFIPSQDGKTLIPVGAAQALSKSSNFFVLMNNLVSAGFPENKLGDDISVLDGLYAYWIGVPEPKRSGLVREPAAEGAVIREKILSCPSEILKLPWDKKGAKAPAAKVAAGGTEVSTDGVDVTAEAVKFVGKVVAEVGTATRQDLAARIFKDLAMDPNRDAIATMLFSPVMQAALVGAGFTIDGENISKG